VATLCILRGSSASRTPLHFSLIAVERLPPWSASFALIYYKVPARALIKKSVQKGCNPLFPNYVGRIGRKPVYEVNGPLESMDDILIRTDRGVGKLRPRNGVNLRDALRLGVPLRKIGGGSFENPAYISGLFWGTHLLPI
jgi:hypothetical protein